MTFTQEDTMPPDLAEIGAELSRAIRGHGEGGASPGIALA